MKQIILSILLLAHSFALAQTIDELLQKAVENNPELKALQLQYEAAMQKGAQVSQLPDPTMSVGIPALRPETRLGPQVVMVSASQMFPWFGTLRAKEDVAIAMAKTRYEYIAAKRLDLFYNIKEAYYQLYLIAEKQAIVRKHIVIFQSLERVALAKVESGRTSAADVLRIKLKLQELKQQLNFLYNEKPPHIAQINLATNQAFSQTISLQEKFNTVARLESDSTYKDSKIEQHLNQVAHLQYDLATFEEKMAAHHPLLVQLDKQIAASQKEQALNDIMRKPSFGVGLDYSYVAPRRDAEPRYNGRDILIPKVSMAIPISKKKYGAKNQEEALKQEAIAYQKEALIDKMLAQLQGYHSEYDEALFRIELAKIQQETTDATYDILLDAYSSKGTGFDELLLLLDEQFKYDLMTIVARVKTHLVKAKVERLTAF